LFYLKCKILKYKSDTVKKKFEIDVPQYTSIVNRPSFTAFNINGRTVSRPGNPGGAASLSFSSKV
jgi:hypothetical protein